MKLLCITSLLVFCVYAEDVTEEDVTFYLNTNFHLDGIKLTADNLEEVNASLPTKFIVHGGRSSHQADWVEEITHSYLKKGDYNVIRVDWSGLAALEDPDDSARATPDVGMYVGKLIDQLHTKQDVPLKSIHVIGHSFGAHVAGFTGKAVQNTTGGSKIARITGLDPAERYFVNVTDTTQKLNKEDAELVDAIHTDASLSTLANPTGAIDFYPNGGVGPQPGCTNDVTEPCSHMRAAWLFAEEVENDKGFLATKCDSEADFATEKCSDNEKIPMGGDLDGSKEGTYYLTTNPRYPFSLE